MIFKKLVCFCTAFGLLPLSGAVVMAFDQNAVVSVGDRPNEYYTAQGGRFRSLIVRPAFETQEIYDDNIYRENSDKKDDFITVAKPSLTVKTNWNLHEVEFGVDGSLGRYSDNNSEDYNDYSYYVSGRYDIDYLTFLNFRLKSEYRHDDRGSLDDVNGDNPTQYKVNTGSLGFIRELGIVKIYLEGVLQSLSYEDSNRAGSVVFNNGRDRNIGLLSARVAYGLSDSLDVYLQAQNRKTTYDLSSSSFRDSDSYDYRSGLSINFTGKAQGDFHLGYMTQKFGSAFDDINALNYGGSLLWNLSDITSVKAGVDRSIFETTLAGFSGYIRTKADMKIEHALRRSIILGGSVGAIDDDYEGDSSVASRDNISYMAGAEAEYSLNNNISVNISYDYLDRRFDMGTSDYKKHKMLLSLRYAY